MATSVTAIPPDVLVSVGDPLLESLTRTASDWTRQQEIERLLVTIAKPLTDRILSRYVRYRSTLKNQDADDIKSTVMLRLVSRLAAALTSEQPPIDDFQNYVATLTYNAIHNFLREQFPQRTRLKNRLRYVVTHHDRLALWTMGHDCVCGLTAWNGSQAGTEWQTLSRRSAPAFVLDQRNPAQAVVGIFEAIGHPVTLDDLSELTADLWDIRDRPALKAAVISDPQPSALLKMERREFVSSLWKEIRELRHLQRKALLLNLRDDETVNVLGLFVVTGIATTSEVASVLEMPPEDLAKIWNELPLPDARIAEMMRTSRQQVINLRKAARKRLIRRLLQKSKSE